MHFDLENMQWISVGSDVMKCGERLKDEIGMYSIFAGTVMVLVWRGRAYLMFQTLQDLVLSSTKSTTLLYYEEGSVVSLGGDYRGLTPPFIPPLRFRDCRFPTEEELRQYSRMDTV